MHLRLDAQSARQWAWGFRALDLYQTNVVAWAKARGIPVLFALKPGGFRSAVPSYAGELEVVTTRRLSNF